MLDKYDVSYEYTDEIKKIIGKTIKSISVTHYLGRPIIHELIFTDNSRLYLKSKFESVTGKYVI